MSNMERNGVNLVIVMQETCVLIVTLGQNNNFIQKYIKVLNAMTYNKPVTVPEGFFVLLLT